MGHDDRGQPERRVLRDARGPAGYADRRRRTPDLYRIDLRDRAGYLGRRVSGQQARDARACARDPRPIAYDADGCAYCRMQISDPRFGAELVTTKGKVYAFDSIECLVAFYRQANAAHDVRSVWVSDYRNPGMLAKIIGATS